MKPFALAILLLLATPALAQEKKDDPLKDCQYGQRMEITLKSGFGLFGKLIPDVDPATGQDIEVAKTKTILLDISLEYPELGGSKAIESGKFLANKIGFERVQVKAVRILPSLTPEEVKARETAREEAYARILAEEAARRRADAMYDAERRKEMEERLKKKKADEAKTLEGQLKQQAERIAKARALYEKFAPPTWGQDKLKEIEMKNVRHQGLTDAEREFLEGYGDWVWYKNYLEEQDKPKVEPPKPEETPKEEPKKEEPKKEPPK